MSTTASARKFIEKIGFELFLRKRKYDLWQIWEAIQYLVKTGCQWRMLPKCYPPWNLVYYYFQKFYHEGWLQQLPKNVIVKFKQPLIKFTNRLNFFKSYNLKSGQINSYFPLASKIIQ